MSQLFDATSLRADVPAVISVLRRRGADFAAAEDAVQEALLQALQTWPQNPPRDARSWLVTVAWRKFLDATRSQLARRDRELAVEGEPDTGAAVGADDSLELFFLCAHPALTASSAIALTLRAIGGLTTGQIADAFLVPEATMAQRISRAKRTVSTHRLDTHGDLAVVLRVLYLVFNQGYTGEVDLSREAIRLTHQLRTVSTHPEVSGLLALMLLHDARRQSRRDENGRLVPLAAQDRSLWNTRQITQGVQMLQDALAIDDVGEYQAQAAIAALHADAQSVEETDWAQICTWYDELWRLTQSPVVQLNRAIALGECKGASAGLDALAQVDPSTPRFLAARAHLREKQGDVDAARADYAGASLDASTLAEREHLARQAARLAQVSSTRG